MRKTTLKGRIAQAKKGKGVDVINLTNFENYELSHVLTFQEINSLAMIAYWRL